MISLEAALVKSHLSLHHRAHRSARISIGPIQSVQAAGGTVELKWMEAGETCYYSRWVHPVSQVMHSYQFFKSSRYLQLHLHHPKLQKRRFGAWKMACLFQGICRFQDCGGVHFLDFGEYERCHTFIILFGLPCD